MAFDGRLLAGLGVLGAVVESGNFARAAEALGLTPSGISRAVARLEAQVGVRLFDRSPRTVALTEEGRRFHAQVAPLLAELQAAAEEVAGAAAAVRGRLRVNVDASVARWMLAPRLPGFLARYPEVSLELVVRDTLGDPVGDGFDAAIRLGVPEPSGLIVRKLLDSPVLTCASPSYLARHGTPTHPRELAGHECLLFRDPATGRPFGWEFRRGAEVIELEVTGHLVVNDLATALTACAAGHGLAQILALGATELLARGELIQVLPEWAEERFPLYAYLPSRRLPPARVRAFLDFVCDNLGAATRLAESRRHGL